MAGVYCVMGVPAALCPPVPPSLLINPRIPESAAPSSHFESCPPTVLLHRLSPTSPHPPYHRSARRIILLAIAVALGHPQSSSLSSLHHRLFIRTRHLGAAESIGLDTEPHTSVAAADNLPTRPPYHDSASTLTTSRQSIPSRLISLSRVSHHSHHPHPITRRLRFSSTPPHCC